MVKFKSNINTEEDVTRVASIVDKEESIQKWEIDTASEENILSVSGENINP